jgi:hypothetical protein
VSRLSHSLPVLFVSRARAVGRGLLLEHASTYGLWAALGGFAETQLPLPVPQHQTAPLRELQARRPRQPPGPPTPPAPAGACPPRPRRGCIQPPASDLGVVGEVPPHVTASSS